LAVPSPCRRALIAAFLVGAGSVACSDGSTDGQPGPLAAVDTPPAIAHIHGLGVNPSDGTLYAATHSGLYRINEGRSSVVANRYQDTMGFTVVGEDHFLASGHPDLREELPPLLGLLESRDAGETWTKRSLLGEADFHALRFAHGRVWGYDSTSSTLMVSEDKERWDSRSSLVLRDFVVSPDSPDNVIASNGEVVTRSEDGGRTWSRIDSPDAPMLLSWETPDDLRLMTGQGGVFRSADSGESWTEEGDLGRPPEAFVVDGESLYAATHSEIFVSSNGGKRWHRFYSQRAEGTR
jgi:hypothetical protein